MNEFLKACRKEQVSHTPIWLMRQAGRYQPEYRAIREKVSFVELCKTPDLAAEVTVFAAEQLGVDAAIIFADILLILEPLGIGFSFDASHGPRIGSPIRDARAVDAVAEQIDAAHELGYVMDAIRTTRKSLRAETPLIGFAASPFTLASYAIEGGGSKNYYETKKLMFGDEGAWRALMEKLTDALVDYLNAQVDAGAQALQVFDSWVGCLSPAQYQRFVQPHLTRLFSSLNKDVPLIHFGTGNPELYPEMRDAGGTVVGVDWRVDLKSAWDTLGDVAIQGNLDPAYLLAPIDVMLKEADRILASVKGRSGHIFNLGHGVMPSASVDQVRRLVDHVQQAT